MVAEDVNVDSIPDVLDIVSNGNYVGRIASGFSDLFNYNGKFYAVGRLTQKVKELAEWELKYHLGIRMI